MVEALEKKGTQGAARKVDDALKARHAAPAGAPKSPTDVRPPDSPPLAAQPGPKPPPAAARPREGGAPGDAGPKAPPQHGGEVPPAGKPTRAEGPPEAGGAQPEARPVKEPEGAKPETPPGREGRRQGATGSVAQGEDAEGPGDACEVAAGKAHDARRERGYD